MRLKSSFWQQSDRIRCRCFRCVRGCPLTPHCAQAEASKTVNRGVAVASLEVVFVVDGFGETEPEIEILNCPVGGNYEALIHGSCIDAGEGRGLGAAVGIVGILRKAGGVIENAVGSGADENACAVKSSVDRIEKVLIADVADYEGRGIKGNTLIIFILAWPGCTMVARALHGVDKLSILGVLSLIPGPFLVGFQARSGRVVEV
jgi:hypothetical protein